MVAVVVDGWCLHAMVVVTVTQTASFVRECLAPQSLTLDGKLHNEEHKQGDEGA